MRSPKMGKGTFTRFMRRLKKDWSERFPCIQAVPRKVGFLPASSTFYAGFSNVRQRHYYLNFQCSSKPWHKGVFTITAYGTKEEGTISYFHRSDLDGDGQTRIGHLISGGDKWWILEEQEPTTFIGDRDWVTPSDLAEDVAMELALADINDAIGKFMKIAFPKEV